MLKTKLISGTELHLEVQTAKFICSKNAETIHTHTMDKMVVCLSNIPHGFKRHTQKSDKSGRSAFIFSEIITNTIPPHPPHGHYVCAPTQASCIEQEIVHKGGKMFLETCALHATGLRGEQQSQNKQNENTSCLITVMGLHCHKTGVCLLCMFFLKPRPSDMRGSGFKTNAFFVARARHPDATCCAKEGCIDKYRK